MSPDTPELDQALTEALSAWTAGDQPTAIERIRPLADAEDATAAALISWFLHQLGEPRWREAIPYAKLAISKGAPWAFNYIFGNMLNDAALRQEVPALLREVIDQGSLQLDPIAHAIGPFQQGDHATALKLVKLAPGPWPSPNNWSDFVSQARGEMDALTAAAGDVQTRRTSALAAIEADERHIGERRAEIESRTQRLIALIEQTTNAEVQSFFDTEATTNETEANKMWNWGLKVLAGAATLAILPLVIYYVGKIFGDDPLKGQNLVAAHFAPAVALGAVAGVLLARARGRDRARQRARDLSVALGTMFVYSDQIVQEDERQRFVHEMGRTVIEAFLRQDGTSYDNDSSNSLLSALTKRA